MTSDFVARKAQIGGSSITDRHSAKLLAPDCGDKLADNEMRGGRSKRSHVYDVQAIMALLTAIGLSVAGAGCGGTARGSRSVRTGGGEEAAPVSSPLTPPGAILTIGQPALVPFQVQNSVPAILRSITGVTKRYELRITVLSVTRAPRAALRGLPSDPGLGRVYYVRFKITNVGRGDPGDNVLYASPTLQSTAPVGYFGVLTRSEPCEGTLPPKHLPPGNTWRSCASLSTQGAVTGAEYTGSAGYVASPVTWAVRSRAGSIG
jgi:hypothetical protein